METVKSNDFSGKTSEKTNFICGVIEGFYGRPWTTEQRKDLFRKLKKWGMDSYVYAPKDDYKHRAYWRELYTVEEADHLSSLIAAAKEHGIVFYYALSPGLDMTYSSQKEIQILKRKLDQVSQFGCEAFALLFDDIESELSKADKEVFQTFANAQVSVTNDVYSHLGNPKFLICPTQYCSTRAVPTVADSEYLNTLGSRLNVDIDIMWTGNKVISKIITLESIQQLTEILRRPPVIWDNLHANDYDQKRVFLGPYCGRSPELIPHLRGVLTNPNCEFHANTIAIHTLAIWSKCTLDVKLSNSFSADVKLENENEDGTCTNDVPEDCVLKNVYHPRVALRNAVAEWLSEFFVEKVAWGPITKPQPQVTMVMPIIPIIPSINTCMSLTTTTTTTTTSKTVTVPEVNTTQLQAFADVCSTVNSSAVNPISNPVMNSLVVPTKVITNDDIVNPIPTNAASNIELPKKVPVSIVSVPIMNAKTVEDISDIEVENQNKEDNFVKESIGTDTPDNSDVNITKNNDNGSVTESDESKVLEEDVPFEEKPEEAEQIPQLMDTQIVAEENNLSPLSTTNEPMECSSSVTSQISPRDERKVASDDVVMADTTASLIEQNNCMQVESSESSPMSHAEIKEEEPRIINGVEDKITVEDLYLLCDLFYLPFEHGSRGLRLLNEFNWLKANANVLISDFKRTADSAKPEVTEWLQRAEAFSAHCNSVQYLLKKIARCANKEICFDLFSYLWDVAGALMLLSAFVKWLALGHFPPNMYTFTEGTYTWFSKGWKEAFMSGDQEPWVFRGGLIADIQRLMPVDSGNDLFLYKHPDLPTCEFHTLRPYLSLDEAELSVISTRCFLQMADHMDDISQLPDTLRELIGDSCVGAFVTHSPEMCIVAQDSANAIVGYAAAALDVNHFLRSLKTLWIPAMMKKYSMSLLDSSDFTNSKKLNEDLSEMIKEFHNFKYDCPADVITLYPAVLTTAVLGDNLSQDQGIIKRLLTVTLAALRASGCFGVHIRLPTKNTQLMQYYQKLGFNEIYKNNMTSHIYLGRRF